MTLHKFNPDGSISYHYHYTQFDDNNGGQREVYDPLFAWNGQEFQIQTPWTHNINITLAITAQFPN